MVNWFYKMETGVFPARQPKLEGWILDFKSSPFLYVLGFCVVGFIIVQSVFFLVRAWRRGKQAWDDDSHSEKHRSIKRAVYHRARAGNRRHSADAFKSARPCAAMDPPDCDRRDPI